MRSRKTYEIFAACWPHTDEPSAESLNSATKHVASTTPAQLQWENSRLIGPTSPGPSGRSSRKTDPSSTARQRDPDSDLLEHGLVDEFRLKIFPLVLGKGKRLIDGGTVPEGIELARGQALPGRVIVANYRTGTEIRVRVLRPRFAERDATGDAPLRFWAWLLPRANGLPSSGSWRRRQPPAWARVVLRGAISRRPVVKKFRTATAGCTNPVRC